MGKRLFLTRFARVAGIVLLGVLCLNWGPKQHRNIMRDVIDGLKKTRAKNFAEFIQTAQEIKYSSYPDLNLPSHGWDMVRDRGGILRDVGAAYDSLVTELKKPVKNQQKILIDAGCLVHYIGDLHTIGQISSEFWGKTDNKIDLASDLCTFSPIWKGGLTYIGLDSLKSELHREIVNTYNVWRDFALRVQTMWFLDPSQAKPYVDRQGAWSVYYGKLALWNAWVDAGRPTDFGSVVKTKLKKSKNCSWWKKIAGLC